MNSLWILLGAVGACVTAFFVLRLAIVEPLMQEFERQRNQLKAIDERLGTIEDRLPRAESPRWPGGN